MNRPTRQERRWHWAGSLGVAALIAALAVAGCAAPSSTGGPGGAAGASSPGDSGSSAASAPGSNATTRSGSDAASSTGSDGASPTGQPSSASSSPLPPGAASSLAEHLAGRSFGSTAVTGHRLVAGTGIDLEFGRGGHLNWRAGCNSMGGAPHWEGATLSVDQVITTEMGCAAPLMAQDKWFADLVKSGVHVTLDADMLTMVAGNVTLTFTDAKVAHPDRALQGTIWNLDGIITGTGPRSGTSSVPEGIHATLRIADGRIHFFDGLNHYDGPTGPGASLTVGPDTVTIHGQIAGSGVGCAEGHTCSVDLSLLATSFHYTITGDRLTVTGIGETAGHGLMFVAENKPVAIPGGGATKKSPPIVSPGEMTPLPTSDVSRTPISGRHDSIPPQPPTR